MGSQFPASLPLQRRKQKKCMHILTGPLLTRCTYLCVVWLSTGGVLLPPRLAAILRRFFWLFVFCPAKTVWFGGPGAAVLPRGTRCTASRHGIRGHSEEGKSLMALTALCAVRLLCNKTNTCLEMKCACAELTPSAELRGRIWLATLVVFRGK